jgi:hypothetical protein
MTDDPREEDKRSSAETAEPSKSQQSIETAEQQTPQQPAEALRAPQTHFAEATLAGEAGFTINIRKIDLRGWRLRYVTDNSDIGVRPGRPSARGFVLEHAEEKLKTGYSGTKTDLAEALSAEVKRHYRFTDELTMCPDNVEKVITIVWRRFRGDAT